MTHDRVSRRAVLKGSAGAIALTGLAGCTGGGNGNGGGGNSNSGGNSSGDGTPKSGEASGTVKIGILQPLSGTLAYYGKQSLWGFISGLAYKGNTNPIPKGKLQTGTESITIDGITYEFIIRDTKLSVDTALSLAKSLVTDQNVDVLFGCTLSSTARKVITQVIQKVGDVPIMLGPAASAGITANPDTCRKNVFRANETTAMDARAGGTYVAEKTDISKIYLFGADYSFGKAVVNGYRTVLSNHGIKIVGEKLVPRGYSQWSGLLQNAAEAGAEGIVAGFTAQTLPALFTAYLQELRLRRDRRYSDAYHGWCCRSDTPKGTRQATYEKGPTRDGSRSFHDTVSLESVRQRDQ
jgi:branched-chain amino acid transport system substrate-binding protein